MPTRPPTNEELIALLKKRDSRSFAILYDNYSKSLYGILFKIVKEEETAENLLQDAFVKIWRMIERYDESKGSLFTWMLNITRNTGLDHLRSKAFSQQSKNQNLEQFVDIESTYCSNPKIEWIGLWELVEKLEPVYRQIILMVYREGYKHEDVAKTLNIPIGTVKTRVRIGIRELKKML